PVVGSACRMLTAYLPSPRLRATSVPSARRRIYGRRRTHVVFRSSGCQVGGRGLPEPEGADVWLLLDIRPDLRFAPVAGAGFEPATSGRDRPLRPSLDDHGPLRVYAGRPHGHLRECSA